MKIAEIVPIEVDFGKNIEEESEEYITVKDDKNLFSWTLKFLDNSYKCKVTGPDNVVVANMKFFIKNNAWAVISLEIMDIILTMQSDINNKTAWTFNFKTDFYLDLKRIHLKAELHIPKSLENLMCMSDSVASLIESAKYTDLILSAQGQQFRCHKAMLMEKSSVFAAMFSHEMKEAKENIVEINDFDADVVKNFLIFIYSGMIADPRKASELYLIADKYDVSDLMNISWNRIKNDSIVEYPYAESLMAAFLVAEKLKDKEFEQKCFNFIKNHRDLMPISMCSRNWFTIRNYYPELSKKIVKG